MNSSDHDNTRNASPSRPTASPAARDDAVTPAHDGGGQADTPCDDAQAARRSGQFGADRPASGKPGPAKRRADDAPHPQGPEYEEGGRYPGAREPGSQH